MDPLPRSSETGSITAPIFTIFCVKLQCGPNAGAAVSSYIKLALQSGGSTPVRIDSANDYFNLKYVGAAINGAGVPRSSIFLTSKVGNAFAMGYNETLQRELVLVIRHS